MEKLFKKLKRYDWKATEPSAPSWSNKVSLYFSGTVTKYGPKFDQRNENVSVCEYNRSQVQDPNRVGFSSFL